MTRHPDLTIGSMFSGIGGLELGLERAGLGPVVWQVEIDPFCRAVLAQHWPGATRYEDVTRVGPELAPVDIICGGFPCQDVSVAGRGAGLDGDRSGLWRDFARIVRLVRPRYVVVENVAALLARGVERVLGDLAACGYDAEWDCVPASAVGAPHGRDRVFILGALADTEHPRLGECWPPFDEDGRYAPGHDADRRDEVARREAWPVGPSDLRAWSQLSRPFPGVCRKSARLPRRVDRVRTLGNAVVPQVAEVVGRRLMDLAGHGDTP